MWIVPRCCGPGAVPGSAVKLGTAILVPYFRNPIDAADALGALSEMTGGREISVGIARGDYAQAGHQLELVKPLAMVRETVECLQRLFRGERVVEKPESPAAFDFALWGSL